MTYTTYNNNNNKNIHTKKTFQHPFKIRRKEGSAKAYGKQSLLAKQQTKPQL